MKEDGKVFFVKSDQQNPTLYFSQLPQYAESIKSSGKGIIFIGNNFIVGLLGKKDLFAPEELEGLCKEMSKKGVKLQKKDQVKFDFKEKGKKPVVTKDICQFSLTGENFSIEKISEVIEKIGGVELS